jgi:MscS family membrane protein
MTSPIGVLKRSRCRAGRNRPNPPLYRAVPLTAEALDDVRTLCASLLSVGVVLCSLSWAQVNIPGSAPASSKSEPAPDPLGRSTPRGTVLGFLNAARKGDYVTARRYLDTPSNGARTDSLARQLSSVLDRRLPARLNQLSARTEGSQYFPDRPDTDLVGTIDTPDGAVDIVVQRVDQGRSAVWLSPETDATPALAKE